MEFPGLWFSGQPFCSTWAFEKKNVQISLNLLPQVNRQHLLAIYQKQINKKAEHLLSGIFPQKLAALLLKQTGYKAGEILQEESFLKILSLVSDLRLTVTGTRSFEYAQVCAGGIDTAFVNAKTMESKRCRDFILPGRFWM